MNVGTLQTLEITTGCVFFIEPPLFESNVLHNCFLTLFLLAMVNDFNLFPRYIEASKARLYHSGGHSVAQAVLLYVFENILKMLHPFMPFVTEALWQVMVLLF